MTPPTRGGRARPRRRTGAAAALSTGLVVGLLLLAGCGGGGEAASDATATTAGPGSDLTTTTTAYEVPPIPEGSVAEICAGAGQIVAADEQLSELLTPLLGAESSDESDRALLAALGQVKPIVDSAGSGYDRMAAVLPAALATDAGTVREATVQFYAVLAEATTIDALIETLSGASSFSSGASEAAARLDATTRKTCNTSLYGT